MTTAAPPRTAWSRIAVQALVAGIAGAVLIDAYLWASPLASQHPGLFGMWTYIASSVAGKTVLTDPNAPWIGLAIHLATSLAWAGAYAYLAAGQPTVRKRWPISGPVYGLVVYLVMQLVLLVSGNFEYPHSPDDFVNALIAHAVFFGLPVAYVVSAMDRE